MNLRHGIILFVLSFGAIGAAQSTPAGMCSMDPGVMYLFLKPDAVQGLGHVAYGFIHGSIGYYGSIEGYFQQNVLESFSCGSYCSVDPAPMIDYFRRNDYERYAFTQTAYVDFQNALREAQRRDRQLYEVVTTNCAHASRSVIDQFAYAILPSLSEAFPEYAVPGPNYAPKTWFDEVAARDGWTVRNLR